MKLSSAALTGLWLWIFLPSLAYAQQEIQSSIALPVAQAVSTVPSLDDAGRPPKLPPVLRGESTVRRADYLFNFFRGSIEINITSQKELGRGYKIAGTYTAESNWRERCNYYKDAPFEGWYGNDGGGGLVFRIQIQNPRTGCGVKSIVLRSGNGHAFWYQDPDESLAYTMYLDPVN